MKVLLYDGAKAIHIQLETIFRILIFSQAGDMQ